MASSDKDAQSSSAPPDRGAGSSVCAELPLKNSDNPCGLGSYNHNSREWILPRGHECILIAEDDELVLSMLSKALCVSGYSVLVASNGLQALELFRKNPRQVHLLVIDQNMPKLSGLEVLQQVRTEAPQLKAILTSGYSDDISKGLENSGKLTYFIGKPYSLPQLLLKIRCLLDS